jgi:hypothetical protein
MRPLFLAPVIASLLAVTASAATLISQQLIPPGSGTNSNSSQLQYGFQLSGFNLSNEAIIIEFDSSLYLSLFNAIAPVGYTALALPGNSSGEPADLVLEGPFGSVGQSVPQGLFDVNFTLAAAGQTGPLPYQVFSVDNTGTFGDQVGSGFTSVTAAAVTPEPASFSLAGLSLFAAAAWLIVGRRRARFRVQ